MYGMRLSQLTPELIDEILDLYGNIGRIPKSTIFWRRAQNGWTGIYHVQQISKQLEHGNVAEWRYGSGLPGVSGVHAKFEVWRGVAVDRGTAGDEAIRFVFDPNADTIKGDEADIVKESFRSAVEELLKQKGLAIELRC